MKRSVPTALLFLVFGASLAGAADLQGFYIGANGGAGFGTNEVFTNVGPAITAITRTTVAATVPLTPECLTASSAASRLAITGEQAYSLLASKATTMPPICEETRLASWCLIARSNTVGLPISPAEWEWSHSTEL